MKLLTAKAQYKTFLLLKSFIVIFCFNYYSGIPKAKLEILYI